MKNEEKTIADNKSAAFVSPGRGWFWLAAPVVFFTLVYLLRDILTPFLAGLAAAYFLDPVADRLERMGCSRTVATSIVTVLFFGTAVAAILIVAPMLRSQIMGLVGRLPDYARELESLIEPWIAELKTRVSTEQIQKIGDAAQAYAGDAVKWAAGLLTGFWSGGMAVFNLISLIVVTPVVSFYMLRDWDRIVAHVDGLLPRRQRNDIRQVFVDIDRTMAGFIRGQASVCLLLAVFYGVGLSISGLEFGLAVGLGTGLLSFIPYFGMGLGLVVGLGIAIVQYGGDLAQIAIVAAVFGTGQIIEGFFLTPKLVGGSVGLHPVWVVFALMAGGALFGFAGVLLAVPMAAVVGVLIRFFTDRYLESDFHGADAE